jgi:hypothetical protein
MAMKESRGAARLRNEIETIEMYTARAERDGKHVSICLTETTIQLGMSGGRIRRTTQSANERLDHTRSNSSRTGANAAIPAGVFGSSQTWTWAGPTAAFSRCSQILNTTGHVLRVRHVVDRHQAAHECADR